MKYKITGDLKDDETAGRVAQAALFASADAEINGNEQ
jgi:hypothetical protein